MHAGSRPEINHVIGLENGLLIVLDHNNGIADIAQPLECAQQTLIVALMQTDRRLIQDIHNARQARSNLAGQSDPLRFTAGQGFRASVEREVVQSDIHEKAQPLRYVFDDLRSNLTAPAGEIQ